MGIQDKIRRLERAAESEVQTLVCQECGEELRVRHGTELDLVAFAWAEGMKGRGHKVYREPPEDVHLINNHPCEWTAFRDKHTGERLLRGVIMGLKDKVRRLERSAEGEMIVMPQRDGTVARFPVSELAAAYL